MMRIVLLLVVAAVAVAAGCDGYDAPEGAEPFDTIAPAPGDTTAVPGADEPGSQTGP